MTNAEPPVMPPLNPPKVNKIVISALLLASTLLIGGLIGYLSYPLINSAKQPTEIASGQPTSTGQNVPTVTSVPSAPDTPTVTSTKKEEAPFCKEYGTYEIEKADLFGQYVVGPGETLRDIAKKKLNDESRAVDFIEINPQLYSYEIDKEVPMGSKIYIPNEKYMAEGVRVYLKVKGNIVYNKDKPMFGITGPNSSTGSFIITDNIKEDLKNIKEGDCVEVSYGSRSIGSAFVVFEVKPQVK